MTTQAMLASVEAQIRKDIPRLMELKEGCVLFNRRNEDNLKIICLDTDFDEYVCLKNKMYLTGVPFKDVSLFEIIGHEIMLNDVLEWLKNKFSNEVIIYEGNNVFKIKGYNFDYDLGEFEWDLPSLYLKDQSEELIKFLYNLIKE
ncbi:hypothetical protein [Capnocytophaga cynodegmi]|uniref:hypothetical protein n=1 Tax=Capnocytophaga cynodegmi TaxID=28189 RepID=UPI00385D963D